MPLFYLHLFNDIIAIDEEGTEFPDAEQARLAAIDGARDLIATQIRRGEAIDLTHRIEVENENHQHLCTVTFAEAVTFQD